MSLCSFIMDFLYCCDYATIRILLWHCRYRLTTPLGRIRWSFRWFLKSSLKSMIYGVRQFHKSILCTTALFWSIWWFFVQKSMTSIESPRILRGVLLLEHWHASPGKWTERPSPHPDSIRRIANEVAETEPHVESFWGGRIDVVGCRCILRANHGI